MKVRIASKGWESYTGPLGQGAVFQDGEADLTERQVRRIGASLILIDVETEKQVGPSAVAASIKFESAPVATPLASKADVDKQEADEREALARAEEARKAEEAKALEAARAKAAADAKSIVYSRQELEAIGANDGVGGLREIADPLGVKGRGITDLVTAILTAQAKLAAE